MQPFKTIVIVLCVLGWQATTAWADEVILKNGDRLTGDIISMDDGTLILKTQYAGDVKIARGGIQAITSKAPIKIQTMDGSILQGTVTSPAPERIVVTSDQFGSTMAIPLTNIQAINPPPLVSHTGSFNLGGLVATGNSSSKAINASVFYTLRADRNRFSIEGKYNYGEQDHQLNVRNAFGQLKYDYFITKRVFLDLFTLFEQDTFQDLNLRTTIGVGPGYQFIDTKQTQLSATIGIAYVNEDWRVRPDDSTTAGVWSVTLNTALVPDRLIFFHRQNGAYDFESPNAWRLRADQGFQIPVYKQFAMNIEYDLRYDSDPAPGRGKTDNLYIVGVSYLLRQ